MSLVAHDPMRVLSQGVSRSNLLGGSGRLAARQQTGTAHACAATDRRSTRAEVLQRMAVSMQSGFPRLRSA